MHSHHPRNSRSRLAPTVRTSEDEIAALVCLSRGRVVRLTGPQFPSLAPRDAAIVLMAIALEMPKALRLRTIHLAVNLYETGDWRSEIIAAARVGDPAAAALASAVIDSMFEPAAMAPLANGGAMN